MISSRVKTYLPWAFLLWFLLVIPAGAQEVVPSERERFSPVEATHAMVVAGESLAARVGLDVLRSGGNAVDAAVAVGFAMAVTHPQAGNLGGGGFMLIYSAETGKVITIDYREKAPAKAQREMFLNGRGDVDTNLSRFSHLSAGVPGTVAGLALALERYGTISLKEALRPAIRLDQKGFVVTPDFSRDIKTHEAELRRWDSTRTVFFKKDGGFYEPGDRFVQKDLAGTLKRIARKGIDGFYRGTTADRIVKEMAAHGGIITHQDLAEYSPVIRPPVRGTYRGYEICSMGPPSSGGVHIIEILNILEGYDLGAAGHNSAAAIHLMAEAMRRAYADRSRYLGDPDFFTVPVEGLISKEYAATLRSGIDRERAGNSREVLPGKPPGYESNDTTHFSIMDGEGNAVSNTTTINFSFGSGIVVGGAGFLLNNEMDDFSAKPGVPNAFGLVGGTANQIAPKKRMLSSMSPTIVLKEGKPFVVTGSPGGSRIITTALQVILNLIDYRMNLQNSVNAPRVHHQWIPDEIRLEEGISPDTVRLLQEMGHRISVEETMGAAESILYDREARKFYGAADPRREGEALGY